MKTANPKTFVASPELLQWATEAAPVKSRGQWGAHWEVFQVLMMNRRGHDCRSATKALVQKGLIAEGDFEAAYVALRCRWNRQRKLIEGGVA